MDGPGSARAQKLVGVELRRELAAILRLVMAAMSARAMRARRATRTRAQARLIGVTVGGCLLCCVLCYLERVF